MSAVIRFLSVAWPPHNSLGRILGYVMYKAAEADKLIYFVWKVCLKD